MGIAEAVEEDEDVDWSAGGGRDDVQCDVWREVGLSGETGRCHFGSLNYLRR